jgi:hypothetical protein
MNARRYIDQHAGLWRVRWDRFQFHFRTRRGALRFALSMLKEQP